MCYTVLVVDDEVSQRRALIERVDWEGAGFKIVGDAENGIDALDMLDSLEPDLILTDIKMPLMNGLELAAKVREQRPATQMVILSGYDNFEYAQQALKYNIIGYFLKPISSSELSEELHKIKERMDRRFEEIKGTDSSDGGMIMNRLEKAEFLLPLLIGNSEDIPDENILKNTAIKLGIISEGDNNSYCVLASKYKDSSMNRCTSKKHVGFVNAVMGKYFKTESYFVNGRIITLIISDNGDISKQLQIPLRELVQSAQRVLGHTCTVGVSRFVDGLSHIGGACFQAITARRYTTDGAGNIRFIDDQEHGDGSEFEYVEKSVYTLEQLLKVGSKEKIEEFLKELYDNQNKEGRDYLVIQILATAHRSVSAVSDKSALSELLAENPIYIKAAFFDNESNIRADLVKLCVNARDIISRYQKRDSELTCDKAIQIIDSRYSDEGLSLTGVSAELGVSPNYLSALIKKTKKKNFVTLLTERRMSAAHDLLLCTSMKILEISEKCGYSDQHYFSYCFKKYYGISPNKIREERDAASQ